MELPKKYKVQDAEKRWQQFWEDEKVYAWDPSKTRDENPPNELG